MDLAGMKVVDPSKVDMETKIEILIGALMNLAYKTRDDEKEEIADIAKVSIALIIDMTNRDVNFIAHCAQQFESSLKLNKLLKMLGVDESSIKLALDKAKGNA